MKTTAVKVVIPIIFLILVIGIGISLVRYDSTIKHPDNYVTKVIDGDTFQIASGQKVRMLCIDTPEEGQKDYDTAKFYLSSLILAKEVNLTSSTPDKDQYNRLLRFVYLDNLSINKQISIQDYTKLAYFNNSDCEKVIG